MTHSFNRALLQVARAARGFTQGELASRAGVTQALISKLENGLTVDPTPETVEAIAGALERPLDFFYSEEMPHGLPPFHYRKRAKLGTKVLDKIEADINLRRIHIARLLKSFEIQSQREFPSIDLAKHQWSPRDAAEHLRGYWMVPRGPIDNLTALVERAGAVVVHIDFDTPLLDAMSFRVPGLPPLIFMNSAVPGDRYRFTLAHELAHLILHNHPETDEQMEEQADEFAAELLMPAKEVRQYLTYPSLGKLGRAKQFWKVSIKALIVQSSRLKLISPRQYTGLNVNYSKAGYSKFGEPFPIPLEKPSTLAQAVRHHLGPLAYSPEELAKLLMLLPKEFDALYLERPHLRLVK
jgi:Zn-dependent peptidase ImmA (M78 family)/transcriptional regulator with XRE-family HTH domain